MIETKGNPNYSAVVVKLPKPRSHTNADRLLCWSIFGNNVITDLTSNEGELRVFFPIESKISSRILSEGNMFSDATLNADKATKGYFPSSGRVKALKFRGERSEGFLLPLAALSMLGDVSKLKEGDTFDTLDDNTVCEKYEVPRTARESSNQAKSKAKQEASRLVDGQFRFHIDTPQLRRNIDKIKPSDIIAITSKLHGTSAVFSNILTKTRLSWIDKLKHKLGFRVETEKYDYIYSSRKVIKNDRTKLDNSFYKVDIWKLAFNNIKDCIPQGVTLYCEIVGYLPDGGYIQKGYDYGVSQGKHKTYVYRGTYTTPDGHVIEFSTLQLKEFCATHGLNMVPLLWYGQAQYLLPSEFIWQEQTLEGLLTMNYLEKDCEYCSNKVPAEGIVVRKENVGIGDIEVYKHKSFRFLEYETKMLDEGLADIETEESSGNE